MAEKLNIPNKVVDSDWKDDVDVDYAIYGDNEKQEGEYISPQSVDNESIDRIKNFQIKYTALKGLKKFREQELAERAA